MLAAGLALGGCASAQGPVAGQCVALTEGQIQDPEARPGLSGLRCADPYAAGDALLLVTDENMSWPLLERGGQRQSFEQVVLDDRSLLGPGFFYFAASRDRVIWRGPPAPAVVISFSGADTVTLAPLQRWLAIDLKRGAVAGAADSADAAFALVK